MKEQAGPANTEVKSNRAEVTKRIWKLPEKQVKPNVTRPYVHPNKQMTKKYGCLQAGSPCVWGALICPLHEE